MNTFAVFNRVTSQIMVWGGFKRSQGSGSGAQLGGALMTSNSNENHIVIFDTDTTLAVNCAFTSAFDSGNDIYTPVSLFVPEDTPDVYIVGEQSL